jgi:hypothetical protein
VQAGSLVTATSCNMSLAVTGNQCISFFNGYDKMYLIPLLLDVKFDKRQDHPKSESFSAKFLIFVFKIKRDGL